jgi:hypothetical protein
VFDAKKAWECQWVSTAHCPDFVGGSPRRFVPDTTTVLAGEPPAESFDRLPPRQLAPSRESWRFSNSERSHPIEHPRVECTRGSAVNQTAPILRRRAKSNISVNTSESK